MFGKSSFVANFATLISDNSESLVPRLCVAGEDVLDTNLAPNSQPFITWRARPLIAEALARAWAAEEGVTDSDKIWARTYGELCATYTVLHMNTLADRDSSRGYILNRLRMYAPSRADIGNYVSEILKKCRPAAGELMGATEVAWHVVPVPRHGVSFQTFEFFKLREQTLPKTIFATEEARRAWEQLSDVGNNYVNLEGIDFSIVEDVRDIWRSAQADTIFGYYEGRGYAFMGRGKSLIAAAMYTYITALTKERNITDNWTQRRVTQFRASVPDITLESFVSSAVITHFANMYPLASENWENIYRQLVVLYSQLKAPQTTSLTWIIEQAANANVTSLLTIADIVSRLAFFDTDVLQKKGIPRENFVSTVNLALMVGRNPFSTIVRPEIQLRSYADLATMCVHIKRDLIEDKMFVGYKAQPTNMCTLASHVRKVGWLPKRCLEPYILTIPFPFLFFVRVRARGRVKNIVSNILYATSTHTSPPNNFSYGR